MLQGSVLTAMAGSLTGVEGFGWLSKLWSLFRGTLNIRCRIIVGIQKGTIILTTTHLEFGSFRV